MIERFRPDALINCGAAGAISPQRQIGDVVISERVIEYDVTESEGLEQVAYPADANLFRCALQVPKGTLPEGSIVTGIVLSGNPVIETKRRREGLWNRFHGQCVEQEGAGVARVCGLHNIPWIAIRGMSDRADEHLLRDFKGNLEQAAENAALVTFKLIETISASSTGANR